MLASKNEESPSKFNRGEEAEEGMTRKTQSAEKHKPGRRPTGVELKKIETFFQAKTQVGDWRKP